MAKIIFISSTGESTEIDAPTGDSVMQAAVSNMVDGIVAECGGCLSCATCHVYVDEAWIDRVGAAPGDEQGMLQFAIDPNERSRLSCQIQVTEELDGLVLHVPAAQY